MCLNLTFFYSSEYNYKEEIPFRFFGKYENEKDSVSI